MNRACSDKERALMRKHGLIFFYGKLGWKIIAEKNPNSLLEWLPSWETSLMGNLGTNWTFKNQCRLFRK